jgi:hypothetical protein
MNSTMRAAALGVVVALIAGCASSAAPSRPLLTTGTAGGPVYRGPLYVPVVSSAHDATVLDRSGAAGRALECNGKPYAGGTGTYDDGLNEVRPSYVDAVKQFIGPLNDGGLLPPSGYRVERTAGSRVLLSFDVHDRTKAAIIAREGIRDYLHHVGWGVETWAVCDPAEYPAQVTDELGIGVWQDEQGRPVPISLVESFPGHDFCDYPGTEYLQTGGPQHPTGYVRDPHGDLTDYLRVPYDGSAALPHDAEDSGFHRGGRELWFGRQRAAVYLVSLRSPADVERWGAFKRSFGCG